MSHTTTTPTGPTITQTISTEREQYLAGLSNYEVHPLWTQMKAMVTPRPTPRATVAKWSYEEMRPLLLQGRSSPRKKLKGEF
jgi:gentisate 1,2-dioxygenase